MISSSVERSIVRFYFRTLEGLVLDSMVGPTAELMRLGPDELCAWLWSRFAACLTSRLSGHLINAVGFSLYGIPPAAAALITPWLKGTVPEASKLLREWVWSEDRWVPTKEGNGHG